MHPPPHCPHPTWGEGSMGVDASMCPTDMTLGLRGACPPPRPHLALIRHAARAVWGRGGGHAPLRASVMSVGHMDVSTPMPPSSHVGRGRLGGGAHPCAPPA